MATGRDTYGDKWVVARHADKVYLTLTDGGEAGTHEYTPDQARELVEAIHNAILEAEETA